MDLELVTADHSERTSLKGFSFLMLNVKGDCYINKRGASALEIKHGDYICFKHTPDKTAWYICKSVSGVPVRKTRGQFRFCEVPLIKKFFSSMGYPFKSAYFLLGDEPVKFEKIDHLFILPKPINQKL